MLTNYRFAARRRAGQMHVWPAVKIAVESANFAVSGVADLALKTSSGACKQVNHRKLISLPDTDSAQIRVANSSLHCRRRWCRQDKCRDADDSPRTDCQQSPRYIRHR